jgi:hypothetical protein
VSSERNIGLVFRGTHFGKCKLEAEMVLFREGREIASREEVSETASYGQGTSKCVPHKCVTIFEVVLFTRV